MTYRGASDAPAWRGIILCLGILAFGALVLWGMREVPRAKAPPVPENTQPKIPDEKLKFVTLDAARKHLATEPVFASLAKLAPDFLFLQNVNSEDVVPIAEGLKMQSSYHPQLFQHSENLAGSHATWGSCVLSRHEIDAGRALTGPLGTFGVEATAVIGGKKFVVASVRLADGAKGVEEGKKLIEAWQKEGTPPILIAGLMRSGLGSNDLVEQGTGWFDGSSSFLRLTDGPAPGVAGDARILLSPGWSCTQGGAAALVPGSTIAPLWLVATSAVSATATNPTVPLE